MRMDPKTRFVLDILARLRGQSISTVVERAIAETAENTVIGPRHQAEELDVNWKDFWHVSEGVRWLKVASNSFLFPSFDEEYKLDFARTHWPFFYHSSKCELFRVWQVDILWPKIDEYLDIWTKTRSTDYWAAGKAMQKAISDAKVVPPDWPIKKGAGDKNEKITSFDRAEMEDEIPF